MVAREIGESPGGEPDTVEPPLLDAMRGGFEREMGDPALGELVEALVERDGAGRREGAVDRALRGDDSKRAQRGRLMAKLRPNLLAKSGDGCFAARACDGGDGSG